MVRKLKAKDITITKTRDRRDLKIQFEDNAIVGMLEFVEKTEAVKRSETETIKVDSWQVERLDQSADEDEGTIGDGVE
jgi:methylmalonyl-CoA mutase N-terminal domain/subunit